MTDTTSYRPEIFDLSNSSHCEPFEMYYKAPGVAIYDSYSSQLENFIITRSPSQELNTTQIHEQILAELDGCPPSQHGRWIYYPWSQRLVHLLPPPYFHELRSNRNQHKITAAEQAHLRTLTIGIVGLSVGHSAAMTLVLEGIGGRYRLADFDELELSNLNRIRTGVHNLGVNKAVVAAREMFELDPYIEIEIFRKGVVESNIEDFFCHGGKLDLLVEECDGLYAKVRLRERARELRIPVLMDTSDGGILDIERFDLEPERDLFHGAIPNVRAQDLVGLSTKEKIPFVLAILGIDQMSAEFAGSLVELDHTLSTWPQLGSSVILGGALVAHSARKVLLDEIQCSGRFSVDLNTLIQPSTSKTPEPLHIDFLQSNETKSLPPQPSKPNDTSLGPDTIEYLLQFAVRAPSAANTQPWRFRWDSDILHFYADTQREIFLEHNYRATRIAVGASIENVRLAAQNLGYAVSIKMTKEDKFPLLCEMSFQECDILPPPLFPFIFKRSTNRKLGNGELLSDREVKTLKNAAKSAGGKLHSIENRTDLNKMGVLSGQVDKLRFLSKNMHQSLISEIRWSEAEVLKTRDGVDLTTLEANQTDRAVLRILARRDVMDFVNKIGGGNAMMESAEKADAVSSGVVLLTIPKGANLLEAGILMQRVWLTALSLELSVWPLGMGLLTNYVKEGNSAGLTPEDIACVKNIDEDFHKIFQIAPHEQGTMLLRLSRSAPPSAYSLRRPLMDVWDK